MMRYSIEARDISKYISKTLTSKYSKKLLDHVQQSAKDALKTASKWAIQKTAEGSCYLIGSKIANKSQ